MSAQIEGEVVGAVHAVLTRYMESDREYLLSQLAIMRSQWEEATGGEMEKVTLNLELFFSDIRDLITGAAQTPNNS